MMTDSYDIPASWIITTLGEAYLVIQGQSPPSATYNTDGVGLPFLQGKAEFGATYPLAVKWCSAPSKIAEPDDVLISIRAPVGPTNLCAVQSCIGRGLAAIRTLGDMPAKYILYAIRATEEELRANSTGTTFEAIRGDDLRSHPFPLAPLAEQHRIVAEIEKQFTRLDASVAALKRVQANLKRYRASVLKAACEGRAGPHRGGACPCRGTRLRTRRPPPGAHPGRTPRPLGVPRKTSRQVQGASSAGYRPTLPETAGGVDVGEVWISWLPYVRNRILQAAPLGDVKIAEYYAGVPFSTFVGYQLCPTRRSGCLVSQQIRHCGIS